MSTTITREYNFSAAHQIEGHPKCGRMHGHNYKVFVEVYAGETVVIEDGWVIDFGVLDGVVNPIIDKLDHRYILPFPSGFTLPGEWCVEIDIPFSTVEHIAKWLFKEINDGLDMTPFYVTVASVTVYETDRSCACVKPM